MKNVLAFLKAAALVLLLHVGQSSAAVFVGDTTGSPTFNRPFTTTALSAVGTDVPYDTFAFSVTADGNYVFRSFAQGAFAGNPTWDNFLILYGAGFDPSSGLTDILTLNDDLNGTIGTGRSGFSFTLSAGETYVLVTTGYENTDDGIYLNLILGPGAIVPVPEPHSLALLLGGMALVGLRLRRRRG